MVSVPQIEMQTILSHPEQGDIWQNKALEKAESCGSWINADVLRLQMDTHI